MNTAHDTTSCAVAACTEILGAKWTALIVHDLSEGARRFSDSRPRAPASRRGRCRSGCVRSRRRRLVDRRSYPESPPRVEYELTAKGRDLLPIIDEMRRFGHAWLV